MNIPVRQNELGSIPVGNGVGHLVGSTFGQRYPDCGSANEVENCSNDRECTYTANDNCNELQNKSNYNARAKDPDPLFAVWSACNRP